MIMKKIALSSLLLLSSLTVSAGTVSLSLSGLEDPGVNTMYEGWLIVDGSPVSTDVFSVDGSGVPSQSEFPVEDADAAAAALFILTIDPVPDADPAPAATHILAGPFDVGMASVTA